LARGKVLGGSSSINDMVYSRGQTACFDQWAEQGCEGWDYAGVKEYFKMAEAFQNEDMLKSGE
jgi:choline dehydrogenase